MRFVAPSISVWTPYSGSNSGGIRSGKCKPIQPFENFTLVKLAPGWIGSFAGPAAVGAARLGTGLANSTLASLGSLVGGTTASKLLPLGRTRFENATSIFSGALAGMSKAA